MWLDKMVSEKDSKIYDRELALYAMGVTMSDQADTINSLQAQLDYQKSLPMVPEVFSYKDEYDDTQEEKFQVLYAYCRSLASERDRLEDHITASMCERKTIEISAQQQRLTESLLALVEKERKTKFIDGNHSLRFEQTVLQ